MICKQPNGLYCRFSSVVDTFTHINMTEQEEMLKHMRFQRTTLGRLDIKIVDGGIEG